MIPVIAVALNACASVGVLIVVVGGVVSVMNVAETGIERLFTLSIASAYPTARPFESGCTVSV